MNIQDVENLAELARIELSEEEKKSLLKDFESILAYVDTIKSVKVENARAPEDLYNVWREDVVEKREFSPDLITGQFPDSKGRFLKVKKIL